MRDDEFTKIFSDLKDAGFKISVIEKHLNLGRFRVNNYRIGATSFTDAEKAKLVKYHKAAMKLPGVNGA